MVTQHKAWVAAGAEATLFEWLRFRTGHLATWCNERQSGNLLLPADRTHGALKSGTLSVYFAHLAEIALEKGVLTKDQAWLLQAGASRLRRGFIVAALLNGVDVQVLQERLGIKLRSSIERIKRSIPVSPPLDWTSAARLTGLVVVTGYLRLASSPGH